MLYYLEQRVNGAWKLLKEVTSWSAWDEVRSSVGSFRLVDPRTGFAEREVHLSGPVKSL